MQQESFDTIWPTRYNISRVRACVNVRKSLLCATHVLSIRALQKQLACVNVQLSLCAAYLVLSNYVLNKTAAIDMPPPEKTAAVYTLTRKKRPQSVLTPICNILYKMPLVAPPPTYYREYLACSFLPSRRGPSRGETKRRCGTSYHKNTLRHKLDILHRGTEGPPENRRSG